jgi:hypothetical protein
MKKKVSIVLVLTLCMVADVAKADFTFGTPINMGPPISTPYAELGCLFTADGLEMYVNYYNKPGGYGGFDIWVSTRETVNDDWGAPVYLESPVNSGEYNASSYISPDGLELYFNSYNRSGGYGEYDIWLTTRATRDDPWGEPENLGPTVNSSAWDIAANISPDGLELYFSSSRSGGYGSDDIWVSRRATKNDPWEQPTNLGSIVNSSASETGPFLSSDGLLLLFSGEWNAPIRPGGFGNSDMWVTRRASISEPWGAPVNLGPIVNSQSLDYAPHISQDGSTLYFSSDRPGGLGGIYYGDIYQAPIIPIVDLNTDGIVDAADMCIMVDHWGEDYSFCDIGPMPWGDGIVDVEDLKVLSEYLFGDMQCVAHFMLDEAKGSIANDSARNRDGTVHGDPKWLPMGGIIGGALQLDGFDDYVETGFVLNPVDGALSAFVWIKSGAPGQVIVSQTGAANWLLTDPIEGNLMTELKCSGRAGKPLQSQTNITDGEWHHVGLVWDGSNRTLYVDDVAIAQDTQPSLEGSEKGLYIGCGKAMEAGTYWSGLIDDVRIYERAIRP